MPPSPPGPSALPVEWSKKAIASVVLGSIGFATVWLLAGLFVAAIGAILGHVARHETFVKPLRGRRVAAFGLVLGYGAMLSFPLFAVLVGASFPAVSKWRSEQSATSRAASRANASRLFVACEAYARANKDRYPGSWDQLSGRYLPDEDLAALLRSPYRGGAKISFELVRHDRPVLDAIADSVVVIQEIAPPDISEIAVVYANGKVAALHNPDFESP